MMHRSITSFFAAAVLAAVAASAASADIVVPGANGTRSGGSNNFFPFSLTAGVSQRYQQLYAGTEFGTAPVTLYGLKFRQATDGGTQGAAFAATIPSIKLNLSTAATSVSTASLTFADNVGSDNATVFDGALALSSTATPIAPYTGTQPFDIVVTFTTPFAYDPTKGDLLLDVFNFSGGVTTLFDFISGGSTAISRVVGPQGNVGATSAFFQQRAGLVTSFTTTAPGAVPEPAAWALMIAGFGLVGVAARRRRIAIAA